MGDGRWKKVEEGGRRWKEMMREDERMVFSELVSVYLLKLNRIRKQK